MAADKASLLELNEVDLCDLKTISHDGTTLHGTLQMGLANELSQLIDQPARLYSWRISLHQGDTYGRIETVRI